MKKKNFFITNLLLITILFLGGNAYSSATMGVSYERSVINYSKEVANHKIAPEDSTVTTQEKKVKSQKTSTSKRNSKKVSFETFDANYERAMKFYEKGLYISAAQLFEELYPLSMGSPKADTILFLFATCYYENKDYQLAVYHFKNYTNRYHGSDRAEEANLMCVKAIYNLSPYYSLDQYETKYAIEEINLFIQQYPRSKFMEECNTMLDELRDKLAKKDFEIAKLYYNTGNYQAAQIAIKNFYKEYSYSKYAAEMAYILVKNNYEFAKKSVAARKYERYQACVEAFETLKFNYSDSPFVMQAQPMVDDSKKFIAKLVEKK